ncbi:hypothetical protein PT274_01520 [Leuconostocaceae bacterium ESL0958]|nr:hypothetical protein [Leuconostocaceae bacterium ESL0958]
MAKVVFEDQPKLTHREAKLVQWLQEIGMEGVIEDALYDVLEEDDTSVDFNKILEAYVIGYEEVE